MDTSEDASYPLIDVNFSVTISSRKLPSDETTKRHVESSPSWVPVPENTVCLVECSFRAESILDTTSSAISGRSCGPWSTPALDEAGEADEADEAVAWLRVRERHGHLLTRNARRPRRPALVRILDEMALFIQCASARGHQPRENDCATDVPLNHRLQISTSPRGSLCLCWTRGASPHVDVQPVGSREHWSRRKSPNSRFDHLPTSEPTAGLRCQHSVVVVALSASMHFASRTVGETRSSSQ